MLRVIAPDEVFTISIASLPVRNFVDETDPVESTLAKLLTVSLLGIKFVACASSINPSLPSNAGTLTPFVLSIPLTLVSVPSLLRRK
jgi:hypothetical protein